jgi:hypothetical protein
MNRVLSILTALLLVGCVNQQPTGPLNPDQGMTPQKMSLVASAAKPAPSYITSLTALQLTANGGTLTTTLSGKSAIGDLITIMVSTNLLGKWTPITAFNLLGNTNIVFYDPFFGMIETDTFPWTSCDTNGVCVSGIRTNIGSREFFKCQIGPG